MIETLFQDIFRVKGLDPDGKKFDEVTHIEAKSEQFDMNMQLDANSEIYPMHEREKFMMVLSSTLNLEGKPDSCYFTPESEFFDRVLTVVVSFLGAEEISSCYLHRYNPADKISSTMDIYVSFGGLLMMLWGDPSIAAKFELDQRLFILIRKADRQ